MFIRSASPPCPCAKPLLPSCPLLPAGTLTLNKMEIQDYCPTFKEGQDLGSVLIASALAAKWKEVGGPACLLPAESWGSCVDGMLATIHSSSHCSRPANCNQCHCLVLCRMALHFSLPPCRLPSLDLPPSTSPMLPCPALQPPKDALDTMVLGAVDLDGLDVYTMVDHSPFDPTIKRTESVSGAQARRGTRLGAGRAAGSFLEG